MTHLLTVLGTSNYSVARYTWQEQQVETRFVAEALCKLFQVDRVTVLLTKEAKEKNWDAFQQQLGDRVQAKDIPSGRTESEIWQIFDAVVDVVVPGEQVIFDITSAFRSIPILVLLAAAFLQKARDVKIQGVYYGAFEINPPAPPIFDLTPAIKLLDWFTATNQFIATGSSVEFSKLLSTIQQDFVRSNPSPSSLVKPLRLKQFGDRIEGISRSIELIRSRDLLTEAAKLQAIPLSQLQSEVGAFAKPFQLLLEQIQRDYGQFGLPDVDQAAPEQVLQKQFLLLRWYVAKDLGTQAILLAREWIVSVLCVEERIDYLDREIRLQIEYQLGSMIGRTPQLQQPIARHVVSAAALATLWKDLAKYRNNIAHTQMHKRSLSTVQLQHYVQQKLLLELTLVFPKQAV
ncbi:MAG: TIGR02221 family CRISPR-associated protein [Cyanobacteria bacterium RU_5_0]|nr:TIGR02221 family CRISPR-associated protein [Cyanobacteria bacterium RU_5_0]